MQRGARVHGVLRRHVGTHGCLRVRRDRRSGRRRGGGPGGVQQGLATLVEAATYDDPGAWVRQVPPDRRSAGGGAAARPPLPVPLAATGRRARTGREHRRPGDRPPRLPRPSAVRRLHHLAGFTVAEIAAQERCPEAPSSALPRRTRSSRSCGTERRTHPCLSTRSSTSTRPSPASSRTSPPSTAPSRRGRLRAGDAGVRRSRGRRSGHPGRWRDGRRARHDSAIDPRRPCRPRRLGRCCTEHGHRWLTRPEARVRRRPLCSTRCPPVPRPGRGQYSARGDRGSGDSRSPQARLRPSPPWGFQDDTATAEAVWTDLTQTLGQCSNVTLSGARRGRWRGPLVRSERTDRQDGASVDRAHRIDIRNAVGRERCRAGARG